MTPSQQTRNNELRALKTLLWAAGRLGRIPKTPKTLSWFLDHVGTFQSLQDYIGELEEHDPYPKV